MSSAGRISISSCFQHGLQDGYLSLKPHVKGGLFPLGRPMVAVKMLNVKKLNPEMPTNVTVLNG